MTAITQAQILTKFSVASSAGNTTAGNAATSLGDQISTTSWNGGTPHDLFDPITGTENAASASDYRCFFVHNSNPTNDFVGAYLFLSSETVGGASISVAVDNIAASLIGATTQQASVAANENTAPSGISVFVAPTTVGTALLLGTIPANHCKAVWIKRSALNTTTPSSDGVVFTIGGDTGAL